MAVDDHEAAFAAIVDRYRTPLQRYCSGIVGPTRAEDAVQQTLISAHDALKRTTEVRHLRSWLYRIAHNTSLNVLRSVRDDVPLDASHAALADGPHAAFERTERLRATLAAVQELPERQRAALVLRELEGRSHEEIATALGVTTGSARQNLMRARAAVRGAVTAVTPYPLVAKLATALASSPSATGWTDVAAGAGAGATIAKLTAGVMATGALVGGAVGTQQIVHREHRSATPAADAASKPKRAKPAAGAAAVAVSDPATPVRQLTSQTGSGSTGADKGGSGTTSHGRDHQQGSSGGGGSGSPSSGSDDRNGAGTPDSGRNRDDHSGDSGDDHSSQTSGGGDRSGSSGGRGKRESDSESDQSSGSGKSVRETSGDRPSSSSDEPTSSGGGSRDEASHDAPTPTTTTTPAPPPSGGGSDDEGRSSKRGSGSSTSVTGPVPPAPTVPSPPLPGDEG